MLRPAISLPRLRARSDTTAASSASSSLSSASSSRLAARAEGRSAASATSRLSGSSASRLAARQGGVRRVLIGVAGAVGLAAAVGALLRRRAGG